MPTAEEGEAADMLELPMSLVVVAEAVVTVLPKLLVALQDLPDLPDNQDKTASPVQTDSPEEGEMLARLLIQAMEELAFSALVSSAFF